MKITTATIFWSLLLTNVANAITYNDLTFSEKTDYDFVLNTCERDKGTFARFAKLGIADTTEYFNYLFISPDDAPDIDNIVVRKGLGKNTHRLLNSRGYSLALEKCYPDNEPDRNSYTINLLLIDAYGKIAAVTVIGVAGVSIYKSITFVGRKIAIAPTVAIFKKLNASEAFIKKLPRYMGRAGVYGINGVTIAAIAHYVYELKKDQELLNTSGTQDIQDLRESLERNIELYEHTLALRQQATNQAEKIAMDALLEEQRQIIDFYSQSLLKKQNLDPREKENLVVLRHKLQIGT